MEELTGGVGNNGHNCDRARVPELFGVLKVAVGGLLFEYVNAINLTLVSVSIILQSGDSS